MRSNVLSEVLIERYVRFPETLDSATRDEIRALLDARPEAQSIGQFYRDCYAELDRLGTRSPQQLEQFIASIFPIPDVAPLYPLAATTQQGSETSVVLVPTVQSNGKLEFYERVALLGSQETTTIVCLLRHHADRELWKVVLITANVLKRANTIITFTEMGLDVLIDISGTAELRLSDLEVDVGFLKAAILRVPTVEVHVRNGTIRIRNGTQTTEGVALNSGYVLRLERNNGGYTVWLDSSNASFAYVYRRIAYTDPDGTTDIRQIAPEGDPALIRTTSRSFSILLYG